MNELLQIKGLTVRFYTYEGVVQALEQVNFDIGRNETFGLVGETGCGKTVAALSILVLPPHPGKIESGSIHFNSEKGKTPVNLLIQREAELRAMRGSQISMVFQEPGAALNPVYTISDQISEVMLLHRKQELLWRALQAVEKSLASTEGLATSLTKPLRLMERRLYLEMLHDPRSVTPRIISHIPLARRLLRRLKDEAGNMSIDMLKAVEIPDSERVAKRYPHELSGGMKQRVVIAMALACSPKLLIADEPTTSLDATIQAQILELMRRLKTERGSSVLYITHDLSVVAQICDRVGVMYAGTLCELAGVEELYTNPLHPYTQALMEAVPKPGAKLKPIGGAVPDLIDPPSGCRFHPRCPRAMDICQEKAPAIQEIAAGHKVACHLY